MLRRCRSVLVWLGARPWLVAALACLGWVGVLQLQLAATRHQLATQLEAARVERGTAARTLHRQAGATLDWNGENNFQSTTSTCLNIH